MQYFKQVNTDKKEKKLRKYKMVWIIWDWKWDEDSTHLKNEVAVSSKRDQSEAPIWLQDEKFVSVYSVSWDLMRE